MSAPAGASLPVTTSVDEARRHAASGRHVVLIVGGAEAADEVDLCDVAGGPEAPEGAGRASAPAVDTDGSRAAGRVHLFFGDASRPSDREAAAEMAAELGARRGSGRPGE